MTNSFFKNEIDRLSNNLTKLYDSTEPKKEYLFVYGLFRDSAKTLLGDVINCGRTSIDGDLFKVNEFYPGYTKGKGLVWGDVYMIDAKKFKELDEFEGHEYNRIRVKTSNDIECWVYQYKYKTENFEKIKSGDWFLR